jgi:hypothetical protein
MNAPAATVADRICIEVGRQLTCAFVMPLQAPVNVPVELRHARLGRWFRMASAVGVEGLRLGQSVPEDLDGPLHIAFHLPGDRDPIGCHGRVVEEVVGSGEEERSERRGIAFIDLDEAGRARIQSYLTVTLNNGLDPFS